MAQNNKIYIKCIDPSTQMGQYIANCGRKSRGGLMPLQIDILEENRHCCEEATHFNLQNGGVTVNFEGKDLYPGKLYIAMTYAGLYVVAGDMYSPIPHCPFCNFSVSDSQIPIQQTEKVFTKNITA